VILNKTERLGFTADEVEIIIDFKKLNTKDINK
jgi:hypothetical protein